jgi:flagellar motor switch protein FliN
MSSSQTSSSSTEAAAKPYAGMLDIPCRVEVIVGTGSITVRECLQLQRDSLIRLTQAAGADLSVLVQGVPAATGEVVIEEETTSVRIADVLPPPSAEAES